MTDYTDIHSCSFHCHRPACTLAQRDQLWELVQKIYNAVNEIEPKNRWTFDQAMAYAIDKLRSRKMLDNIPITNPARDRAWEAFIKRRDVRKMFNNEDAFKFPLSREYYDMWCLCWAKAWDAGFYEGYKAGEEAVKK